MDELDHSEYISEKTLSPGELYGKIKSNIVNGQQEHKEGMP